MVPRLPLALAACAALLGGDAAVARAQAPSSRTDPSETQQMVKVPPAKPRVEVRRIRLDGVRSIDATEARDTLKTRQSSCRLILLAPLCRFTPTLFLVNKKYLDRETVAEDATRLQVLYWRHGYREAQVDTVIVQRPGHLTVTVTFRIREGTPTTLRALDVVHEEPRVLSDERVARVLGARPGEPFDVIALERAMLTLKNELWDAGYADARVTASVSRADTLTRSVAATVTLAAGEPTRVGRIEVEGNRTASEAVVRSALTLQPGELFRRRDVLASQRSLFRSALFERALIVMPQPRDASAAGGGRTVRVSVQEGPARRARVGAGFSTVDFLQASALLTHNDFLGGARRLDVRGAVTNLLAGSLDGQGVFRDVTPAGLADDARDRFLSPMWQAGVTLTQPWLGGPANTAGLSLFAHRRSAPAVFVDRGTGAEATFAHEMAPRVTAGASYRAERTRVDAADSYFCGSYGACEAGAAEALRAAAWLAPAAVALLVDRADDPDFPTAGFTARLDAEAAAAVTRSAYRHARLSGEASVYRALGSGGDAGSALAARVRAGWARPLGGGGGTAGGLLHPRKRFYAGGMQSVRGYGENRLGPRALLASAADLLAAGCTSASIADGSCDASAVPADRLEAQPLGGGTLVEASAEWRVGLREGLGAALFADGAYVGVRGAGGSLASLARGRGDVTPGAGLRVYSALGVLRLDLGFRLRTSERLPVLVAVPDGSGGGGADARVVRLSADRRFDELEGAHGTLRRTLRRMTLHFTVGQAF